MLPWKASTSWIVGAILAGQDDEMPLRVLDVSACDSDQAIADKLGHYTVTVNGP